MIDLQKKFLKSDLFRFVLLVCILLFGIWRSWLGTRLDSFANDEPFHIVAGAYYYQKGDYRINPEHPPLSKLWVGLWNNNMKLRPFENLDDKYQERHWLQEIMYYDNDDHLSQKRSRSAMYVFHFIIGLIIAILVWHIFGITWATFTMTWLAMEPNIAAHQPLVLTDLPLSYTLLLSALVGSMVIKTWQWKWLLAFGISVGLALSSKHSAIPGIGALVILFGGIAMIPLFKNNLLKSLNRLGKLLIVGLIALTTLWSSYGFQNHSSGNQDSFNRPLEKKMEDLNSSAWKGILRIMTKTRIVPRAYIWGMADTVRAGLEGRGDDEHFFFGKVIKGRAPRLYFPGVLISKIPIPLILMSLLSSGLLLVLLYRFFKYKYDNLKKNQWICLMLVAGYVVAHLFTLAHGRTSYGGIRHALPVVSALGLFAGALSLIRIKNIPNPNILLALLLFGSTVILTFGEKRIWNYYNEIVGGTDNAYKYFYDEGLYLGQRFYETKAFFDQPGIDKSEPIRTWTWFMEEELKAAKLNYQTGVSSIHDNNIEGIQEGYFLQEISNFLHWPNWDPAIIEGLDKLKRIGNVYICHGQIKNPKAWASSMNVEITKYLRTETKPDWNLVVKKLEQTTSIIDWNTSPYVLLGNAFLRTNKKENALNAYRKARSNLEKGDPFEVNLSDHINKLEETNDLNKLENLRSFSVE